jgi:Tol biopolymer transport system component
MLRRSVLWLLVLAVATCDRAPEPSASSPRTSPATTSPSDVAPSPSERTILFHSDPGGDSRLSLMRPDGSELTLLTDAVAGHPFGVWSPDGSRVAFLSGSSGQGRLEVIAADGGEVVTVTDMDVYLPDWAPDGSMLVFEAVEGGVYTTRADGSDLRRIADEGSGPVWSPDGSRIAYFSRGERGFDLFVMGADGSAVVAVTDEPGDDVSPAWSPDGARIAFVSDRGGSTDLFVVDADGSGERQLTDDPSPDEAFTWSPDGARIAYVSYRNGADPGSIGIGDAEVFVVEVRGGRIRNLSRDPAWDGDPAWSPDGRWIAFTRRTDHGEIYVMRADGSDQRMLEGFPGLAINDCCARWRPRSTG